jgi:hypothetical protein
LRGDFPLPAPSTRPKLISLSSHTKLYHNVECNQSYRNKVAERRAVWPE